MSTKTLILSPRFTPDSIALWRAATELGWQVERLSSWRAPIELREQQLALYGEPLFAAVVADTLGLAILEPPFSWLADLPDAYRLREVKYTDLNHAREQRQQAFIKPADDKCFPAKVYDSGKDLPAIEVLAGSTPVLISEPVRWEVEFRCFILDRQVRTLSVYSRDGELAQGEADEWPASKSEIDQAGEFVKTVLADSQIDIPPAVVIDVGIIANRGWAVIEANACWASGIYGCDPANVLDVLSRAVKKKEELSDADSRWVLLRGA
jgi:hypothetical protein